MILALTLSPGKIKIVEIKLHLPVGLPPSKKLLVVSILNVSSKDVFVFPGQITSRSSRVGSQSGVGVSDIGGDSPMLSSSLAAISLPLSPSLSFIGGGGVSGPLRSRSTRSRIDIGGGKRSNSASDNF